MSESKEGRRVLILPVEGELGDAIQEFRKRVDPTQAVRIPPHLTLAYWAGVEDADALEKQVRHALPPPGDDHSRCSASVDRPPDDAYRIG